MSALATKYEPSTIESKWYAYWEKHHYFTSTPDDREPYAIVIPPPNVTGVLHMGHMLNNTIQDVLARKARLDGKNVCWVPGTDHASIATEAKVVKWLREKGITKSEIGRDKFMEYAWEWTEKYGGIILDQLKRIGASCDWSRTAFTLDESRSEQVIQAFVDLYRKGRLYRDLRMVNWDPEAQTVLSNEEVIYQEEQGLLYKVRYQVKDSDEYITIATTRPETIMADTAIAVHPDDERYTHLHGMEVIVPIVNRVIPIILDDYVDREFGTGALKVTPAHDLNDYEIGKKHGLEVIDILHPDGSLNEKAQVCIGEDRAIARKKIAKMLDASGHLVDKENYTNNVGRSERTQAVVEPRLSLQWFVDMKELAKPALENVLSDALEFFPKNMKNTYRHWMENIRDWCISRQLWWGHRIPAYYIDEHVFVATTPEQALAEAREKLQRPELGLADLKQDEDVLDTWFSSWLWPFSVFHGMNQNQEVDYYYPTAVLVTGWDIMFLWVARMIMAGYEWKREMPFRHVYFTGMVRDKQRRKMSKSLGNSPDALELIDTFGADGVRFGMLSCSPAGGDLLFDEKLCEQGRNFANKIWNALRLIEGWEAESPNQADEDYLLATELASEWMEQRMNEELHEINVAIEQYRLSEALIHIYRLIWNDYCSWYLEMIKPAYGAPTIDSVKQKSIAILEQLMVILHPFMPFISEEIYAQLHTRKAGDDCMSASWPMTKDTDSTLLGTFQTLKEITSKIRDARNKNGLKAKDPLELQIDEGIFAQALKENNGLSYLLKKMAALGNIEITTTVPSEHSLTIVTGVTKSYLLLPSIDAEAEVAKLKAELKHAQGFVAQVQKKLSNERFVNNAPNDVVQKERKKLQDGQDRIKMLEESLAKLND